MVRGIFWGIVAAACLPGCAQKYVIKPDDQTALVRLATDTSESTVILHVPQAVACAGTSGELLADFNWVKGKQLSEVRMLGSTGTPQRQVFERRVVAGRPFYILAWSWRTASPHLPGYNCSLGAKTIWQPDHQYELTYELNDGSCNIHVSELSLSGGSVKKTPYPSVQLFPATYTKDVCGK